MFGLGGIDPGEWRRGNYGPSTAAAVLAYKQQRNIINRAYQQQPDNIVGMMTITQLDAELCALTRQSQFSARLPVMGGLRDSAALFEARRCLIRLKQRAIAPTSWAFNGSGGAIRATDTHPLATGVEAAAIGDLASDFNSLLAAAKEIASSTTPPAMLSPLKGGHRDLICSLAARRDAGPGVTFQSVKDCWKVVEAKESAPDPVKLHWCGIYATAVLRDSAFAGASWRLAEGICHNKKVVANSSNLAMLAPGDVLIDVRPRCDPAGEPILVKGKKVYNYHHMLVTAVALDRRSIAILQGNSGNFPPESSIVTRVDRVAAPLIRSGTHVFKSVDSLLKPGVVYH